MGESSAASRQVVYESERVILAWRLRGFGDRDHLLGFVDGLGQSLGD